MNIFVFGLGAIGSNLLLQLISKFSNYNFYGIDYDRVEDRNVLTQAYFLNTISVHKPNAMIPVIACKMQKYNYKGIVSKITSSDDAVSIITNNTINDNILILDCFDNSESREYLCNLNFPTLHIGFSPHYTSEILWDERYSVPQKVDPNMNDVCEMVDAVSFINYTVSLTSMIVSEFSDTGVRKNFLITHKHKTMEV